MRQLIAALSDILERIMQSKPISADMEIMVFGQDEDEIEALSGLWENLKKLWQIYDELQRFAVELSKGELGAEPPPRSNYLASGLKQMQMHLRHLTWQTKQISEGDYSQKVDFMGEFSESFNLMVSQLRDREYNITAQRETMLRVFNQIEPLFIVAEEDPGNVLYANKMASLRFHLDEESQLKQELLQSFRDNCHPQTSEQILDTNSGRWYRVSCESFFWEQVLDSRLYHCVDITAHVKRESDLEQEAYTDKLTGLNNRYAFERAFDQLWDMCRQNKSPLSVIIFDIDLFKSVNDTYGHLQGDRCLVAFADLMRSCIGRFSDVTCRFGGEEFVALLPFTSEEAAMKVAESVRTETEKESVPLVTEEGVADYIKFTVSGGIASAIPSFMMIPDELLEAADKALYQAKQTGRNKICIADLQKPNAFTESVGQPILEETSEG